MNLLDYIIEDEKIKQYLHLHPVKEWSSVIKKTLLYGIESIQAFESAGLYSFNNQEGGSHTRRESQRSRPRTSKKASKNSSRRKFSTDLEKKKQEVKVKKHFLIVDKKKSADVENEHSRVTPKHRPIWSESPIDAAKKQDVKISFVKNRDRSSQLFLPESMKEFYQNEFKQLLPDNVPKRLQPMDLKLDDDSYSNINQSSLYI